MWDGSQKGENPSALGKNKIQWITDLPAGLRGRVILGKGDDMKVIDVDALNEKLERLAIQRIKGDDGYDVLTVSLADVLRMIDSLSTIELETTVADKMSRKLDALGLPVREYNCLRRYGIDTIAELYKVQQDGMLPKVRNLGRKSMETVEKALDEFIEVKQLPPIQPKREKWILVTDNNGQHFECNRCGEWRYHQEQKFCGECGAEMEGTE